MKRTAEDRQHAVKTALKDEEWSQWSAYEIATLCAVSHTYVNKIRAQLETVSSCAGTPQTNGATRTYKKKGKKTTMNTKNIGKTKDGKRGPSMSMTFSEDFCSPWFPTFSELKT